MTIEEDRDWIQQWRQSNYRALHFCVPVPQTKDAARAMEWDALRSSLRRTYTEEALNKVRIVDTVHKGGY